MPQLDYFDNLYADNADPWQYQTRWYEHRKRAISLAVLPHAQYQTGIELGCGNGVFSQLLASYCQQLLCLDGNVRAVQLAQQRLTHCSHARVEQAIIPDGLPVQVFDLIVISEILYYLTQEDIDRVITWVKTSLAPNGTLLCCHWRYPIAGFEQTGETVHGRLQTQLTAESGFFSQVMLKDADFLLNVWQRSTQSVAQQEGLVA